MKSIKFKIILLILVSSLSIAFITSFIWLSNSYKAFKDESVEKLQEMTFRYASEFNHDLSEVENIARSVELMVGALFDFDALESEVYYMDRLKSIIKPVIKNLAEEGNRTQSAYIFFLPSLDGRAHDVWYADLDYSGEVILQEEFEADYYDDFTPEKEWFFVPYISKEPYWTNPYWGNADYDAHINYISHTRPVLVDDQVIGVAGSDYHFNLMKEDIEAIKVYQSGKAFLFNENGDALIHDTIPELMNLRDFENGRYQWILKRFNDEGFGTIDYTWIDGQSKLLTYKRLNNQWIFGLTVDVDQVFVWFTKLRRILVWAVLLSIGVLLYLAYRIGHYITKDLVTLTDHVAVIGDGNYDHGLTDRLLKRKDETGILARSIEQMRLQQKKSFETIREVNDALEVKIKERTLNLEEKTQALLESLNENEKKTLALEALNKELHLTLMAMKDTQRQLIESEKLASLGFLVARLAHEFNTPIGNLTTISSYLIKEEENIYNSYKSNKLTKNEFKKFFDKFQESTNLLVKNIDQLKIMVGKFKELDPQTSNILVSQFHFKTFVEMLMDGMDILSDRVHVELLCEDDLSIKTDPGKLGQILIHLIENAIVHGFDGLDEGLIIVEAYIKKDRFHLWVKDNGQGMTPEKVNHIFDPFFSGKLSDQSSGLGLTVVYNIVTKMFKGSVACQSDIHSGTSFHIEFPLQK